MFFNGLPHCVFVEHLWIMKCPLIKGLFYQGIDSGRTFVSAEIWKVFFQHNEMCCKSQYGYEENKLKRSRMRLYI